MVDPLKIFWVLTNSTYLVTKFVRIGIADKNDSPPYFEREVYETDIEENAELQTTVLTISAKDHDEAPNIRYQITGGNIGNAFAVQNTTGAIYIANPLDYETRPRYELRLEASRSRKTNYTTVVINVRDVNDNPPTFDRQTYRTQITEEDDRNLPKRILQVTATDGDVDRPINIVYFLTGQGIDPDNTANSKFDINRTTGDIFVLKPLDRDQPNGRPQWRFTVFAQDEGGEGLVGYADIQVNLKDINDNAPQFPQGIYYGNVTENGTAGMTVMTMSAVDYDDPNEGTNAKLVYSIEKNVIEEETGAAIFEIEPETGVIKTAVCCLDRERTPDYSIQVVAMDGGGLKGTGTASIRVKDLNDMPPQFTKDEWFTEVDETNGTVIPETPILTVTVQDEDEINTFQYKVVPNSGFGADKFAMVRNSDGTGSLKIIQPLDYEDPLQSSGFRFRIQVNDMGEPSTPTTSSSNSKTNHNIDNTSDKYHVAYSWVIIKLRDINDNQPHFERDHIEVSVYEDIKVGTVLEQFRATDADQSGQSRVSYKIVRASNRQRQFSINSKGAVSIQRPLDRETAERHFIKILAIDDGQTARTATATLSVVVKDVNDNAPVFKEDYRPVLPENVSPRKIIELYAKDADDRARGNAGTFTFRLDPRAELEIQRSFKVDMDRRADNGNGIAIVSSLRPFDREVQKAYLVPIEIKDNGSPPMTGTSTLTITIGDVNDNKMLPGSKDVVVYNYQGQSQDTQIGRVYVYDMDDWDVPDKKYYWEVSEHQRFKLDTDTGILTMRAGTRRGRYQLRFKVYDREHGQVDVPANVSVTVRDITQDAVQQAGSMRLTGITDEDFVRIWDYTQHQVQRSKLERFRDKLAELLYTDRDNVNVFSVQLKSERQLLTDVHFAARSAQHQPYFKAVRLNGIVLMHREEIEKEVGLNITMVGIDECLFENSKMATCTGSCTNRVEIGKTPYTVSVNKTALVGVRLNISAECTCQARNFTKDDNCRKYQCFNGGRCVDTRNGAKCVACPVGYNGPRCQQTTRSFRGNGWAWYPALQVCEESHLSLEFITRENDGLILYNGPIVPPKADNDPLTDFIAIELEQGFPRLLIDFGSGTLELRVKTKKTLDDGIWHRLDIFWDTENVRMVVDFCRSAEVIEAEDGSSPEFDDNACQARGLIPPFNEALNLNTPLQLGGLYRQHFDQTLYRWQYAFTSKGFDGCIRNVIHNSQHYDLAFPALARNSYPACPQTDEVCLKTDHTARCWEQGNCVASLVQAKCHCQPGWTGPTCNIPTIPTTFKPQSYVKFALSFEPDRFSTQLQLRFRTREQHGEIFRVSDQHQREYAILELKSGGYLLFRYNLNSLRAEEHQLMLSAIAVNDGQWHVVRVNRFGSAATLEVDGGEGRRYNESFNYIGHQLLSIDKQEGVYAGGKAEYTGVKTFEVQSDFQRSCLDDIRLDGKHLPLPPSMNGTQWGQATMARNLERNCPSNRPCSNVICPDPFDCVDLWNEYECTCSEGRVMSADTKGCVDRNECLDLPCLNGATCINLEPRLRYRCICPEGYWGENCELVQEGQRLKLSIGALGAIFVCLIIILILALIFVLYNRKRKTTKKNKKKRSGPEKDVRETVITYDDEGGGEDDMTAFDITPLQIPIGAGGTMPPDIATCKMPIIYPVMTLLPGQELNVGFLMEERKLRIDKDPNAPPFDELRNFTFEGSGSIAESLSSLASGGCKRKSTDDENQDFKYLEGWGTHFSALAAMYVHDPRALPMSLPMSSSKMAAATTLATTTTAMATFVPAAATITATMSAVSQKTASAANAAASTTAVAQMTATTSVAAAVAAQPQQRMKPKSNEMNDSEIKKGTKNGRCNININNINSNSQGVVL